MMATDTQDARALLAKMDAEQKAADDAANKIREENEKKRKEILTKLRKDDLEDVRQKCKLHGITATELRGYLKGKGAAKKATPTKSTAKKTTTRRSKAAA